MLPRCKARNERRPGRNLTPLLLLSSVYYNLVNGDSFINKMIAKMQDVSSRLGTRSRGRRDFRCGRDAIMRGDALLGSPLVQRTLAVVGQMVSVTTSAVPCLSLKNVASLEGFEQVAKAIKPRDIDFQAAIAKKYIIGRCLLSAWRNVH
jgi:hypothetical protein